VFDTAATFLFNFESQLKNTITKVNKLILPLFLSFLFLGQTFAQAFKINFSIEDYDNDTLIVGYYYGDKQLVKDTLYATKKGEFTFSGEEKLEGGMYLALLKPDNSFVQFIVNDTDTKFDIKFKKSETSKLTFKNSKENSNFYAYMDYIKEKSTKAGPMRDSVASWKKTKKDTKALDEELKKFDDDVKAYQTKFLLDNKGTYIENLIKSSQDVDVPEFEGPEEETQMKRYRYYKKHYFDNIDWNYKNIIRTPYLHQKIDFYIKKLTIQNPDSIIISIKEVLKNLEKNPDAEKYFISHFLTDYANSKIIGMDKIFVWMSDNYYAKGKTPWVKEENLKKITEGADKLRNILIGEIFPNITTYKEDGSPVVLHNVQATYTLLVFWAPDCGHCKKSMPDVLKYAAEYKDKGLTTISICTKQGDKAATCWEGVKEKGMEAIINTGDQYQRYRQIVDIPTTPKMFILDSKKEILFKDLPAEELGNVMKEILKMKEEKERKTEKE
jgi:thiol-disulfide isomerase/thioredoxin